MHQIPEMSLQKGSANVSSLEGLKEQEKENCYSSLLQRARDKGQQPSRFEQYLLVKLRGRGPDHNLEGSLPHVPRRNSAPKTSPPVAKSKAYVVHIEEASYTKAPVQQSPLFNTQNWTQRTPRRSSMSRREPIRIALENIEHQNQDLGVSNRNIDSKDQTPVPSYRSQIRSSHKQSNRSSSNDNPGVISSIKKNIQTLNFIESRATVDQDTKRPLTSQRNYSANSRAFVKEYTSKLAAEARVEGESNSELNDSILEKHMSFVRSLDKAISKPDKVEELIDEKIREKLENPVQEQLFLHLRKAIFRPDVAIPSQSARSSARKIRATTPIRALPPSGQASADVSVEMGYALKHITQSAKSALASRNNSPAKKDPSGNTSFDEKMIPNWLKKRNEFKTAYSKKTNDTKFLVPTCCEKSPFDRTYDELTLIMNWLTRVSMFRSLPSQIHQEIAGKLTVNYYKEGQTICRQGEEGHCLYIIYDGTVDVYVNNTPVASYKGGEAVGRQALENAAPRNATLIAKTQCSILILARGDYQTIMLRFISQEKQEYISFLRTNKFFKDLSEAKLSVLASNLLGKFFYKGDVFYKKGEQSETFYIIKEGKVCVETNVELEKNNKWPTGSKQWKVKKTIRTVLYKSTLEEASWFGDIELIRRVPRLNKVTALTDCYILYLNAGKFHEIFDNEDIRRFRVVAESRAVMNIDIMQNTILEEELAQRNMTKIMIDAMTGTMRNINYSRLDQFKDRKVAPYVSTMKKKLKTYIKQSTIKVEEGEEIVENIIDT